MSEQNNGKHCLTCNNSNRYGGPSSDASCAVLGALPDPSNEAVVAYCVDSGCNEPGNRGSGWPEDLSVVCPAWEARL